MHTLAKEPALVMVSFPEPPQIASKATRVGAIIIERDVSGLSGEVQQITCRCPPKIMGRARGVGPRQLRT